MAQPDKITREVMARVEEWSRYAHPYLQDCVAAEERYNGIVQRQREGLGFANTNDLEFVNIVDANVSGRMAVILQDDPPFRFTATSLAERRERRAAASQAFMKRDWTNSDAELALDEIVHDEALFGTGMGRVAWSYFERYQTDKAPNAKGIMTEGVKPVPYRDHSVLKPLSPWDLAFEVGPWEDINEAAWTCESIWMGEKQLNRLIKWAESQKGNGWLARPLKGLDLPKEAPSADADTFEDQRTASFGVGSTPTRQYRVRWYVGEHVTDKDKPVDYVIAVVNDTHWVVQGPNPFDHGLKGYVLSTYQPQRGHPYGRGIFHRVGGSHDEMNELGNTMTDIINLALAGIFLAKGATPLKQMTLDLAAGNVINVADFGQSLEQLFPRIEAIGPGMSRQDRLRVGMRTAGAAPANAQAAPSGADFSSEIKQIAAQSARQVSGLAKRPASKILKPYLFMAHELQKQYNGRKIMSEWAGEDVEWSREHLLDNPEIELLLAANLDNPERMLRRLSVILKPVMEAAAGSERIKSYVEPMMRRIMSLAGIETRELPDPPPAAAAPAAGAPGAPADPLAALAAAGVAPGALPGPAAPPTAPVAPEPVPAPATPTVTPATLAAMRRKEQEFRKRKGGRGR